MSHCYSEVSLVEQSAIQLFSDLGWKTVSALEEVFGIAGTLGRETKDEAVLLPHLRAPLARLNLSLLPEADRSVMSLATANRDVYGLLK